MHWGVSTICIYISLEFVWHFYLGWRAGSHLAWSHATLKCAQWADSLAGQGQFLPSKSSFWSLSLSPSCINSARQSSLQIFGNLQSNHDYLTTSSSCSSPRERPSLSCSCSGTSSAPSCPSWDPFDYNNSSHFQNKLRLFQ